jgi:G:T-mismatch repair DNA endonuclease (very short patch repair protein)
VQGCSLSALFYFGNGGLCLKQYKDKEWLSRKYVEEGLSLHQIGKMCGVDAKNIQYWMNKFDLPIRSKKDAVVKHFADNKVHYYNTCGNCSKPFAVADLSKTRPGSKAFINYCSDSCRASARAESKQTYKRECPCCGNNFDCDMKCMTDPNSTKFKKYCSQRCVLISTKKANTWIEREIESALGANNIAFTPQHRIGRFTIDFAIPSKKIAIEANGDFWHANPKIYDNRNLYKIQADAIEKDARKLAKLDAEGYEVYIVWENDLKVNKDETLEKLIEFVS